MAFCGVFSLSEVTSLRTSSESEEDRFDLVVNFAGAETDGSLEADDLLVLTWADAGDTGVSVAAIRDDLLSGAVSVPLGILLSTETEVRICRLS